jgi:hypothetical protein
MLGLSGLALVLGVQSFSEPAGRPAPAATTVATPTAPSGPAGSASVGRPAEAEVVLLPRRL